MILKTRVVETKFGKLYITSCWRDNELEGGSYVCVLDEDDKQLDYYTDEFVYEWCENEGISVDDWINNVAQTLEGMNSIEELLEWLCVNYDYCGKDENEARLALANDDPAEVIFITDKELKESEYVAHIGEYIIVLSDYC